MIRIRLAEREGLDDFKAVYKAKEPPHGQVMRDLEETVKAAYVDYVKRSPALEDMQPCGLGEVQKKAMIHAYEVRTTAFGRVRAFLFDTVPSLFGRCLYCGIDRPVELDHYLEKSVYPEFAIFYRNLVPSCGTCNKRRGAHAVGRVRRLLHPFDDPIDELRALLVARVTVEQQRVHLGFSLDAHVTEPERLFVEHCEHLGLIDAFNKRGAELIGKIEDDVKSVVTVGLSAVQVRRALELQAAALERNFGKNHHEVAALRGAAASDDFLQHCGAV